VIVEEIEDEPFGGAAELTPYQQRSERPVLLAVDQLGEGAHMQPDQSMITRVTAEASRIEYTSTPRMVTKT